VTAAQRSPKSHLAQVEGLVGAAAVDLDTGSVEVAFDRVEGFDLEFAALLEGEVFERASAAAGLSDTNATIDSIVFVVGRHLHVIVPARGAARRFLYLLVERDRVPLGLVLHYLESPRTSGSSQRQDESGSAAAPGTLKA